MFNSLNKTPDATRFFIFAAVFLIYCPFLYLDYISLGYTGDTLIQLRHGLDMLSQGKVFVQDIYSWHPNLNWSVHEAGWSMLLALSYKALGLFGIILLTAILNYSIAGIIVHHNIKLSHPFIIVITAIIAKTLSYPNYNARPHLVSQLLIVLLIYVFLSDKITDIKKCIFFVISTVIFAWCHGGMVPLYFVIFFLFSIFELIYRNFRRFGLYMISLVLGFAASLLNPIGFGIWKFGFIQSNATDIWKYITEWQPKTFSIFEITMYLLLLVAFAVDSRVKQFDKKTLIKLCLYCMFLIMTCKYCRFMNFSALTFFMFGAEEFPILLNWINDNIFHFDSAKIKISNIFYYLLSCVCIIAALLLSVLSWKLDFNSNNISDISRLAAFDENVISLIKEKDYKKIYNSFNTGTWLAYYGIKVHIDNRTDLYLKEFSGTDHIRGKLQIKSLEKMNDFVKEYDSDAFVFDLSPNLAADEKFINELYKASDKYKIVYDKTSYSDVKSVRWIIVECVK